MLITNDLSKHVGFVLYAAGYKYFSSPQTPGVITPQSRTTSTYLFLGNSLILSGSLRKECGP